MLPINQEYILIRLHKPITQFSRADRDTHHYAHRKKQVLWNSCSIANEIAYYTIRIAHLLFVSFPERYYSPAVGNRIYEAITGMVPRLVGL